MSDFISRQAAIDEIKALYEWHDTVTEARAVDHLKRLPSAQPDLSGYSDRLWERAYDCGYERCRQDAIDAFEEHLDYLQTLNKDENPTAESKWYGVNWARNTIDDLPPRIQTEPLPELLDDGTLVIPVPNGMLNDVKRVLVDEVGTKDCKVMYQDDPERKTGHWIKISPSCIYECSVCHQDVLTPDIDAYEFCHHCGAEMRGEEHETD